MRVPLISSIDQRLVLGAAGRPLPVGQRLWRHDDGQAHADEVAGPHGGPLVDRAAHGARLGAHEVAVTAGTRASIVGEALGAHEGRRSASTVSSRRRWPCTC